MYSTPTVAKLQLMIEIKSQLSNKTLHLVYRASDMLQGRTNLVPEEQFIQCAAVRQAKGTTFNPHKHIWKDGPEKIIAQESWVVISGSICAHFFDTDGTKLKSVVLEPGDVSFTLDGGHTLEILSNDTLLYEYKNGPYTGINNDKVSL
jgi:cupin fold WbuC family metalloprotein